MTLDPRLLTSILDALDFSDNMSADVLTLDAADNRIVLEMGGEIYYLTLTKREI